MIGASTASVPLSTCSPSCQLVGVYRVRLVFDAVAAGLPRRAVSHLIHIPLAETPDVRTSF